MTLINKGVNDTPIKLYLELRKGLFFYFKIFMNALNSSHFPKLRNKSLRNNLAGLIDIRPKYIFYCFLPQTVLKTT